MTSPRTIALFAFGLLGAQIAITQGAVFTASGANPAAIQPTVDSFRTALGGVNNGVGGSFATGRREINWDGVPNASSAPNNFPAHFFNFNSPRGVIFSTDGCGFQVSASAASGTPVRFGNLNAAYTAATQTFSAERLFTALGSNTVQIDFFIPGTNIPATVVGFGAVFTDVETAGGTKFTVFYGDGTNGGQFAVPTGPAGGLSFLGLTDTVNRYSRIIIQFGTATPGAAESLPGTDVVFMDDFIYGEPLSATAGACCNRWTGHCVIQSSPNCASLGLRFDGPASTCSPATCKNCPADFDGVGGPIVTDIFAFLTAWFAGCP